MFAGRIVSGIPDQQAVAVGGALAFLEVGCLVGERFIWVSVAEQPKRSGIGQRVVTDRHFEGGGIRLFSGRNLAQRQQLVEAERRTRYGLVTQYLLTSPPSIFGSAILGVPPLA